MKVPQRYTVTSALPYANGPLHIGHVAGAYLPADIFVRLKRLQGKEVAFICGSDEHGAAITIRAKQEGVSPQEIIDKYYSLNKKAFQDFSISFDIFHRTSAKLHHETAQNFFLDLYNKGVFEEKVSEQFYDEDFGQFLADRYVKGTCPVCSNDSAYGDQCEKCGKLLSPIELINPISTLSGKTPTLRETRHWFLPLNKEEKWLKEWVNEGKLEGEPHHNPKLWKKNVMGQVNSWLNAGLHPRSITRDLDWGVSVPEEINGAEGKKLYVWLDAPIGYISATKQLALDGKIADWKPFWQSEDTELLHFIGKDNIVFHSIIFPAILKAKGDYILPKNVPANEFMNLQGDKISTSRNWAVWLHEYLAEFPDKVDELRYVLCANMPETKDSEFTWEDYQTRINSELVGAFGNFVNRILVLTDKYFDGKVVNDSEAFAAIKEEIEELVVGKRERIEELIDSYKFRDALDVFMLLARDANKFLTTREPWKTIKTNEAEAKAVLFGCAQIVANLAVLCEPFLPSTAGKIAAMMQLEKLAWHDAGSINLVKEGHQLGESGLLFEKIDTAFIQAQKDKLEASKIIATDKKYTPVKEEIQFEDFAKMDIRVGTIIEAVKVPKADRLLQFTVDLGFEKRTIISGVAAFFSPEDTIGKQVQVLVNLAPRKMRGVVSEGMILFAEDLDGKLHFVAPASSVDNGSGVN